MSDPQTRVVLDHGDGSKSPFNSTSAARYTGPMTVAHAQEAMGKLPPRPPGTVPLICPHCHEGFEVKLP